MDLSTTLSLVQTILAAIQTLGQLQSVCSISNCKSQLDDLQNTVETVRAVLMDADAKQDSLNFQEKNYIQELKDAVYDADDVLDEFLTLAKRKQLRNDDDSFPDKVKSFFSRFKHLTHKLSSKVKRVNDKLNKIATKSDKFSFKVDFKPMKFTKDESSSFMCDKIIGREEDVEKIIGVLLSSDNVDHPNNVSFLAIMGMGGLGKTALAQLVYNDPRISETFQLKRWTCVADQDQKQLDLKGHLGKVVKGFSVTDKMSLEDIHHEVKQQLGGKKYLLVLDDLWTENYDQWQTFEGFLKVGGKGSCIIITTRSRITAHMIGGDQVHVLQGLSEPESWNLFERMAFQAEERDDELVELGKDIVKNCINVPLAIRVIGSLLHGQPRSKWLSFHEKGLYCLSEGNDTMTRILKLSYDQLDPSLKACFAYCAIFPKDWEISKQMLLQLWMAQGYINSENLGEEYFLILHQRCFFQDILKDEFGGIKSFKIHDLLHDIAEKVAGEEFCRFNFDASNVGKRVRHLSLLGFSYAENIYNNTQIRTCLFIKLPHEKSSVDQLLASTSIPNKWICLRSLDLSDSEAESLPKSIGQLLHLRSLDLSFSTNLIVLPESITKLVNLQTLNLHSCKKLKQLPNDVSKLVNLQTLNLHSCTSLKQLPGDVSKLVDLSTLNVAQCYALNHMPARISMLTGLHTLCQFVVGERTSSTSKNCFNGLEDLQHLNKLKGSLEIEIAVLKNAKFVKEEHGGGGYLRSKEHLEKIVINFREGEEYGSKESEQALLEELQPHRNVKTLMLNGYHGEILWRWPGMGVNSTRCDITNLVTLHIQNCSDLLCLPWQIGKLPHLKKLYILHLPNMEFVMDADSETLVSGEGSSFFTSLEELQIHWLPQLKGWWSRSQSRAHVVNPNDSGGIQEAHVEWVSSPCILVSEFPTCLLSSLLSLSIFDCPQLKSVGGWLDHLSALEYLYIQDCPKVELGGMSWHNLAATLQELDLNGLEEMEEMPEGMQYCTSLRYLSIMCCPKLKSVPTWMPKLTSLQELYIVRCSKSLKERCQKRNGEDWPLIQHILHHRVV